MSRTLLVLVVWFALAGRLHGSIMIDGSNCSTVGVPNPRTCCRTFLEVHEAIAECLPKADQPGTCLALCVLGRYTMRPPAGSVSMSRFLNFVPKLANQLDQCKVDLYDFLMGGTFEGDFRRVVCDARMNRFLECMLKAWLQDCMAADGSNEQCNELLDRLKAPGCRVAPFFAISVTE